MKVHNVAMPMPTKLLNHVIFFALIYQNHIKTICSLETGENTKAKGFQTFPDACQHPSIHPFVRDSFSLLSKTPKACKICLPFGLDLHLKPSRLIKLTLMRA